MSFSGQPARIQWPPLTSGLKLLLIVYGALFVATLFKGSLGFEDFLRQKLYLSWEGMFGHLYLWQPLTHQLLHGDFFHLLFNSLVLYSFGGEVERRWGAWPFVRFVILCGLGGAAGVLIGDLLSIAALGGPGGPTVGASGGIYGVVAAFCLMNWDRPMSLMFIPGQFKARWLLAAFIGLDLFLLALSFASPSTDANISFSGHMGGLAAGMLIVTGYYKPQRLLDRLRLWRARRRLRLMRGGHPLDQSRDKRGPTLH